MAYLVIFTFALIVSIIVFIYQLIAHAKIPFLVRAYLAILLTFIIMLGSYIREVSIPRNSAESRILSPLASPISQGLEAVRHILRSKEIEKIILEETDGQNENFAVAIKNLKTGEEYFKDENKRFNSASLYKLWVMAETFEKIDEGTIGLDTQMSDTIPSLNRKFGIASESAELHEGTISLNVKDALVQMITLSANYPAYLLNSRVNPKNINNFLLENNFFDSDIGSLTEEPYTTPLDIFQFFEKLYRKALINQSDSERMIEMLKDQQINDRIPKYLPAGTKVAHKTGELYGNKHNAGIVYSPKGDYIIVLFSNTQDTSKAAEIEARISKRVWDYFNR